MKIEARLARTITIGRRTVACERHEEDACTIRFGPEPASNLVSVHPGQPDVHERDVRVSRLEQLEPDRAVFSQQYLMPCKLEQHAIHLTRVLIVFHDEHTSPGHLCEAKAKTVPCVFLLGSIPEQSRLAVSTVGETRERLRMCTQPSSFRYRLDDVISPTSAGTSNTIRSGTAKLNSDRMLAAADRVFGQPPKQLRKVTAVAQDTARTIRPAGDYNWRQRMAL